MKYEFKKNGIDEYTLIYTNKDKKEVKKDFKRTVKIAQKLNGITARSRIILGQNLSSMGMTKDDIIIMTKTADGKTIYDETNYNEMLKGFIEEESIKTIDEIIEESFGMNVIELFKDMGLVKDINKVTKDEANQITLFTQKFSSIIRGEEKTPSTIIEEENN